MTPNEYQEKAMRTLNPALSRTEVLLNGVMGLCGEAGEAIDIVKKWMAQGHKLDKQALAAELGDIAWYLAETAHALHIPLEDVLRGNIDKLERRFPQGFDAERSIHRDTEGQTGPKRLSQKLVIVLNGRGGVGKDTLVRFAQQRYRARMVSAITPVKEIAQQCGWQGEKDARGRRFLSDLKRLLIEYNDLPNRYLTGEYETFLQSGDDILFVQCRESDQIEQFRRGVHTPCIALLVRSQRGGVAQAPLGNVSDDQVEAYPYDYRYDNNAPLDEAGEAFCAFLRGVLEQEGIRETEDLTDATIR